MVKLHVSQRTEGYKNISQVKRGHDWRQSRSPGFRWCSSTQLSPDCLGGRNTQIKSSKLASAMLVSLRPACTTWDPVSNKTRAAVTAAHI